MKTQRFWIRFATTALMAGLAACGGDTAQRDDDGASAPNRQRVDVDVVPLASDASLSPERDVPSQIFGDDGDTPVLRYFGMTTDQSDGSRSACLRFSHAPDPERVVEDKAFVRLSPEAPFSLQVRDNALCVLGLPDDVDQQSVTVLPGFRAANGAELRSEIAETVAFDPKPAMVGFVGDGIILPRGGDAVLGLKAMNADAVELTLYRVNHRALFDQSPDVGETTVEGDWSWNSAAWDTRVEVHSERIDTRGDVNELVEVGYALGDIVDAQGAGAYIVEIQRAAGEEARRVATAWRWLYVTDLALASYRTSDALDVTVRSIDTSETVDDVKLTLIARNNDILAQVQSDANGRARFPGAALRGTGNLAPKMLLAYAGDEDFAALDLSRSPLDLTAYDVAGREAAGPVDAFLYTERGVYRPGETVHLTALIRDAQADAAFDRPGLLRIRQPDGTDVIERRVQPGDLAGALIEDIAIPRDAPRGRWTAELDLDGLDTVGAVRFSVEDFIPEQLRLDLRADDAPILPGTPRDLTIAADFLYGASGRGLETEAEGRVAVDPNPFPQLSGYTFGDAAQTYREQFVDLGQGLTDDDGLYTTSIDLAGEAFHASAPLRIMVTAGVAEPGGRYVRDSLLLPLRSETTYVGFDPAFEGGYAKRNTPARIDLIAVDANGERQAVDGTISLIREDYDYHWYREDGRWRYRRDRRDLVIDEAAATIGPDTPFEFAQALPYGEYRLQFRTDEGTVFSYQFGSGWSRADGGADAPDRIELGLSQAEVSPGDTIVLTANSPFSGTGELVIADRAVRTVQTVRIEAGESEIRLPLGRDWTSDLYAMLTVYSPGSEAQAQRAVGLVHIPMDRSDERLDVSLDLPEQILPRSEQDVVVQVAGLDGEAAFLTLAGVDSGILQITDYDPPDPEAHYFGKLAFPIDVFDDYARMLAPFSGTDRVGGDSLGGAGLSVVPTQIVSLFQGPVQIENGRAVVTLDVPDFQGELTVMSVAWSDTKLGSASSTLIVRDPVTAQLALPRFLAPGDRSVATVALDNVDGDAGTYTVLVRSDGETVGRVERELNAGARSEDGIDITADRVGISTYALAAQGPGFAVDRDYKIETRAPVMPETRTRFLQVEPGETARLDFASDREGLLSGTTDLMVSASYSPGLDARPLLASLQRYPYGCTEQTVSVGMPLLLAKGLGGIPGFSDAQRDVSIRATIDTLVARQSTDGTFGLWRRDDGHASPYLQLYVSDFLLQAAADGYDVSSGTLSRTLDAVRALSRLDRSVSLSLDYDFGLSDTSPDYELRAAERAAYALALLARHDRVRKTDLIYLDRRFGERLRSSIAQSQLGYALAAMGETVRAEAAFTRAAARIDGADLTYYDSAVRNAAALIALSEGAGESLPEDALTQAMLALQVEETDRLNTHEKAWVMRALAGRRMGDAPFADDDDGNGWRAMGPTSSRVVAVDIDSLSVENDRNAPIWLQVTATGLPDGPMQARSQGADLNKSLFTMDGRPVADDTVPRGERIVVRLDADARSANAAMWVVADLLPAGFEIETILSPDDAGETGPFGWLGELSEMDMAEARDDRFVTSWRTSNRYGDSRRRTAYVLRAVTQGDFALPGAHLEDMYRPSRMATTAGGRISVTPAPSL